MQIYFTSLCGCARIAPLCWRTFFLWRLTGPFPDTLFPPSLHFIFNPFFHIHCAIVSIEQRPACTWLYSEKELVIYLLSFSFPRNVTKSILMTWHQMTMDRTWGKVSAVLLYSKRVQFCYGLWPRLALRVLVGRKRRAWRWDGGCVHLCVLMHASMCMSFIFPISTVI